MLYYCCYVIMLLLCVCVLNFFLLFIITTCFFMHFLYMFDICCFALLCFAMIGMLLLSVATLCHLLVAFACCFSLFVVWYLCQLHFLFVTARLSLLFGCAFFCCIVIIRMFAMCIYIYYMFALWTLLFVARSHSLFTLLAICWYSLLVPFFLLLDCALLPLLALCSVSNCFVTSY